MAANRKGWEALSPAYQNRLKRSGITKTKYESGISLKSARGHKTTPEHGMKEALRKPTQFRTYITRNPEQEAIELNSIRDAAFKSMQRKLKNYKQFRPSNVRANVYGGVRSAQHHREESLTEVKGMSYTQASWTAKADTEAIRSRASSQSSKNPWWYH